MGKKADDADDQDEDESSTYKIHSDAIVWMFIATTVLAVVFPLSFVCVSSHIHRW